MVNKVGCVSPKNQESAGAGIAPMPRRAAVSPGQCITQEAPSNRTPIAPPLPPHHTRADTTDTTELFFPRSAKYPPKPIDIHFR